MEVVYAKGKRFTYQCIVTVQYNSGLYIIYLKEDCTEMEKRAFSICTDQQVQIARQIIPVDDWVPEEQDKIFRTCKGALVLPVSKYFGTENDSFDKFILSTKRCYNGEKMLYHLPLYMNYFEKFYDPDSELLVTLFRFKYLIDYRRDYSKEMFIYDLRRYIMSDTLMIKAHMMNEDNYCLHLDLKKYKNDKNPSLQYSDRHAKILMWISLVINMMIPLLTHFAYMNKISNVNEFLLEVFDMILKYADNTMGVDIYSKLYETAFSNISKNAKDNSLLWDVQDIRGENVTTHSLSSVNNIILNIIPKYVYNMNIVFLNYSSIRKSTGYQITEISYEYNFVQLSSSKRDQDQNSEWDRYESFMKRNDGAIYLQNKVNSEKTMENIEFLFGPFDEEEIMYYNSRLMNDHGEVINSFQKELIFNLFYKYFGDTTAIYSINRIDYIKLLIAAKHMLLANNMIILPYIISSKVERLQIRKTINKKEATRRDESQAYKIICEAYHNDPKILAYIDSVTATILASDFRIIDFYNDEIDGKSIINIPDLIREEVLMYVILTF